VQSESRGEVVGRLDWKAVNPLEPVVVTVEEFLGNLWVSSRTSRLNEPLFRAVWAGVSGLNGVGSCTYRFVGCRGMRGQQFAVSGVGGLS
jgi:hypothetical protein